MKKIALALTLIIASCSLIPKTPMVLNEPQSLKEFSTDSLGVLAFEVAENNKASFSLDITHVETDQNYRVKINPRFANYTSFSVVGVEVASQEHQEEVTNRDVALYALPEGSYVPAYKYFHINRDNHAGLNTFGDTIKIYPGQITSLGKSNVKFDYGMFKTTVLDLSFDGVSIDEKIKETSSDMIKGLPIKTQKIKIEHN